MAERNTVPRGRHAPPLEVRHEHQLQRLGDAAARVFARSGYADATAEAIAREAGMSKATFYEHYANKEDCIIGLFDRAMNRLVAAMEAASASDLEPAERYRVSVRALLAVIEQYPDHARALLIEIIGAGPRAMDRRDAVLRTITAFVVERNREDAARERARPLASEHDAFALVGAVLELAARQIRTGAPENISDLEPVILRLLTGLLSAAPPQGQPAAP